MSTENLLRETSPREAEKICYSPPTAHKGNGQDYLIYFIAGNPGLISFYEPFLSHLHSLLSSTSATNSDQFHICGHSYRGFEILPESKGPESPLGLEAQIDDQEDRLYDHVQGHWKATGKSPKVILMGHSVGAYILLELIQRHQNRIKERNEKDFDLIGGILLFPTIADIAQSPLGRVARLFLPVPGFTAIVGAIVSGLTSMLPVRVLGQLVRVFTKFPDYAAKTTTAFIKSRMGVRQALFLARDEMEMITEDKWDAEVLGAATAPGTNKRDTISSNLVLYWGKNDSWVANHTRDRLMAARGYRTSHESGQPEPWKPVMMIDNEGMPHDFCTTIRNSHSVANKVKTWIDGIIETHHKAIL